jgi:isoquinoline 1-oxidoreductase beta subunit
MKKWTRRAFITTGVLAGGTLILGIAIRPGNRSAKVAGLIANKGDTVINIWLKISPDNIITVIIPHSEMGQGIHTTLAMMLADEMDADWSKVRFQEAPANKEYANYALAKGFLAGEANFPKFLIDTVDGVFLTAVKKLNIQLTGGSASVRFTGMHAMRVAGAAARAMFLKAAAEIWNVETEELTVKNSEIVHAASNRSAPYSEFAQQAAKQSLPAKPRLKSQSEFTIMGTSLPRLDIPVKVTGEAKFGIDASLPGMKYASIKSAPVFGSKVKSVNSSAIEKFPGVHKVVNLGNAVAVIADGYWQAKNALEELPVEFEKTANDSINQSNIYEQYSDAMDAALRDDDLKNHHKSGNVKKAMEGSSKIIEAEYQIPFLAHATMEPMNCTAWIHDNTCELWCGSQNPLGFAGDVAELLDMNISQVIVHNQFLGGGFGRRAETDVAKQAALLAKEVDYPVKLIWSREEDIRHDMYREASISRMKAALNSDGLPVAITHQFLFKHHPPEAADITYDIENQLIHYSDGKTHVPWGNWRSVDHSTHGFFIESFIDELAFATGKNPYSFRHDLSSKDSRFQKVLDLAAEKGNWNTPLPPNWGRGIAIQKSFGSIVAEVAEVEITDDGKVRVHRVVCAVDAGFAMHPNGLIAQMESGIIYGLTAALTGEITIENGAVVQGNFHDYRVMRMNEAPLIETHIINSGNLPGGAGEPSTPVIAPAVTNAIFNATGIRIRKLPIKHHDLSRAKWKNVYVG